MTTLFCSLHVRMFGDPCLLSSLLHVTGSKTENDNGTEMNSFTSGHLQSSDNFYCTISLSPRAN